MCCRGRPVWRIFSEQGENVRLFQAGEAELHPAQVGGKPLGGIKANRKEIKMANIVGLDLSIDQDYLAEAVKQTVMMGISESLNGKNEIVSQIVKMVLSTKVDKNGKVSSYSNDNKYTLLEFHVRRAIEEITCEELQALVNERKPEITQAIRAELAKKVNYTKFVDSFFTGVESALSNTWVPKINVEFDKRNEGDY